MEHIQLIQTNPEIDIGLELQQKLKDDKYFKHHTIWNMKKCFIFNVNY